MGSMTATQHEPARDIVGRFTDHEHTHPELSLAENYLEDDSDGSDFDIHDFYEVTAQEPSEDDEEAYSSWLEEQRTPQGMDEHFDRPDPTLTDVPASEQMPVGAWGNAKPF